MPGFLMLFLLLTSLRLAINGRMPNYMQPWSTTLAFIRTRSNGRYGYCMLMSMNTDQVCMALCSTSRVFSGKAAQYFIGALAEQLLNSTDCNSTLVCTS